MSNNDVIQDAIWEWLHGFYSEVSVQRKESIPQRIEFTLNDRETNQDITGYVLKGYYTGMHYTGMHAKIVLGFISIWSLVNRYGMNYHARFSMKNRNGVLRSNFSADKTFSENDAREFSQWVDRSILRQNQPNYDAGGSLSTPKIPL